MYHRLDAIKAKGPREPTVGDQHRNGQERSCAQKGLPKRLTCSSKPNRAVLFGCCAVYTNGANARGTSHMASSP